MQVIHCGRWIEHKRSIYSYLVTLVRHPNNRDIVARVKPVRVGGRIAYKLEVKQIPVWFKCHNPFVWLPFVFRSRELAKNAAEELVNQLYFSSFKRVGKSI